MIFYTWFYGPDQHILQSDILINLPILKILLFIKIYHLLLSDILINLQILKILLFIKIYININYKKKNNAISTINNGII